MRGARSRSRQRSPRAAVFRLSSFLESLEKRAAQRVMTADHDARLSTRDCPMKKRPRESGYGKGQHARMVGAIRRRRRIAPSRGTTMDHARPSPLWHRNAGGYLVLGLSVEKRFVPPVIGATRSSGRYRILCGNRGEDLTPAMRVSRGRERHRIARLLGLDPRNNFAPRGGDVTGLDRQCDAGWRTHYLGEMGRTGAGALLLRGGCG